jgi:hypothetical protein
VVGGGGRGTRRAASGQRIAAAFILNIGSTYAHLEGCLVHVFPSGSVVAGRDYSFAAAAAAAAAAGLLLRTAADTPESPD